MSQTMDIAVPKAKDSLRAELREERRIGKMTTNQIAVYLTYRHRTILWAAAFMLSNTLWIVLTLKHKNVF